MVRDGLRGMFAGDPEFEVVGEAADGAEAVDHGRAAPARRGADGPAHAGHRRRRRRSGAWPSAGNPARVLVLTTYDTDADVVPAIEAGATGYLLKDTPREELVRAVRAAHRGESVLAPSVATRLVEPAPDARRRTR